MQVVTSSSSDSFQPHPEWLREQIAIAEHIITAVLQESARFVVREATRELIKDHMGKEAGVGMRGRDDLALYTETEV
jgi:hypothetical protein